MLTQHLQQHFAVDQVVQCLPGRHTASARLPHCVSLSLSFGRSIGLETDARSSSVVRLYEDDAGRFKSAADLVQVESFGSLSPRSNALTVTAAAPDFLASVSRVQPTSDRAARNCSGVSMSPSVGGLSTVDNTHVRRRLFNIPNGYPSLLNARRTFCRGSLSMRSSCPQNALPRH